MEHIKNIEITNFKSIRHAEIKDCRRINVFIGYPNVGKSNIIEAITSIQLTHPKRPEKIENFIRFEDIAEIFFEANIKEGAIVSYNNSVSIRILFDQFSPSKLSFSETYFDPLGSKKLSTEVINNASLVNTYKYQFLPKVDSKFGFDLEHLQSPFGENIFSMLAETKDLRTSFNKILEPYNLKLVIDKVSNSLRLTKSIDSDSLFLLSYSLLADTIQRLFFYRTAIYTNKDSVLLFEEPEAHMFPPYISKFTSDMLLDKNNNQYFITTHSPYILNDFMEDIKDDELAIYLVSYKKETGETVVDKLNKEEVNEAYQFGYDFFLNMKNFIPVN